MRITRIRFKNIHSLQEETTIDLEAGPLSQSKIFLITGPTGAGKTTLLDVITLALYDENFRSKKLTKDDKYEQIVSKGQYDAFAEIEFSIHGQEYRAHWSVKKSKKTGNFRPTANRELHLSNVTTKQWEILSSKKSEVDQAIVDIVKLNFEQFVHTVVLAQGEFSSFLRGDKTERTAILERITASQKYKDISMAAYEKWKEEKQKLDGLENELRSKKQEDLESVEELHEQIEAQKEKAELLRKQNEEQEQILALCRKIEEKQSEEKQQKQELEELLAQQEASSEERKKLELHERTNPLRKNFRLLLNKEQQELIYAKKQEQEEQTLTKRIQACQTLEKELLEARNEAEQSQNQLLEQKPLLEQAAELDKELNYKKQNLEKLQSRQTELGEQLRKTAAQEKKIAEQSLVLQQNQAQINTELQQRQGDEELIEVLPKYQEQAKNIQNLGAEYKRQKAKQAQQEKEQEEQKKLLEEKKVLLKQQEQKSKELDGLLLEQKKQNLADFALQEQEDMRSSFQDGLDALTELLRKRETWHKLYQELQGKEKEQTQKQEEIKKQTQEKAKAEENRKKAQAALEKYQSDLKHAEFSFRNYQARRDLKSHRGDLQEGCPCPLCGAKEHPFAQDFSPEELDKGYQDAEKRKKELTNYVKDSELDLNAAHAASNQAQQSIELFSDFVKNIQTQIETLQEQVQALFPSQNLPGLYQEKPQWPEALRGIEVKKEALAEQMKLYIDREKIYKETEQQVLRESAQLQGQELQYQKLQEAIQEREQELEQQKANYSKEREELLAQLEKRSQAESIAEALEELDLRKKSFLSYKEQAANIEKQLGICQAELANCKGYLLEKQQEREKLVEEQDLEQQSCAELQTTRRKLSSEEQPLLLLKKLQTRADAHKQTLQKLEKELHGQEQALDASKKSLETLRSERAKGLEEIQNSRAQLEQGAQVLGFAHLQAFAEAIIDDEQSLERMRKNLQTLDAREKQLKDSLQKLEASLLDLKKQRGEQSDIQALEEELQARKAQHSELLKALGRCESRLDERMKLNKSIAKLEADFAGQQKELELWEQLSNLIGSSTGQKFSSYAQSITLQQLIRLANRHLKSFLRGRYRLSQRPENISKASNGLNLDLDVLDKEQASVCRPLSSLSGGESFLVSLALALALSDLSGGQNLRIESLFIDEGFGSLDAETLRLATHALQCLADEGKRIGIISHVALLRESIDKQIRVVPSGSGLSKIYIEG